MPLYKGAGLVGTINSCRHRNPNLSQQPLHGSAPTNAPGHTHNQALCTTHSTHLHAELWEAEDTSGDLVCAADMGSGHPGRRGREPGGECGVCVVEVTR